MNKLQEMLADTGNVRVRDYSGRGMYGKRCLAITGSNGECQRAIADVVASLMQEVFDAAMDAVDDTEVDQAHDLNDETQELVCKLLNNRSDSMGLDVVMYWPDIEYVPSDRDEELDEEDEE